MIEIPQISGLKVTGNEPVLVFLRADIYAFKGHLFYRIGLQHFLQSGTVETFEARIFVLFGRVAKGGLVTKKIC